MFIHISVLNTNSKSCIMNEWKNTFEKWYEDKTDREECKNSWEATVILLANNFCVWSIVSESFKFVYLQNYMRIKCSFKETIYCNTFF